MPQATQFREVFINPHTVIAYSDTLDKFADVVVDLETLGVKPGCPILEVSAAVVVRDASAGIQLFPTLSGQLDSGARVDSDTLNWWMDDAQRAACDVVLKGASLHGIPVHRVLERFADWLSEVSAGRELRIWGNGPTFDLGILCEVYDRLDIRRPWQFWQERDLRTVFDLAGGKPEIEFSGTKHVGLFDARHELAQLHTALTHIRHGGTNGR